MASDNPTERFSSRVDAYVAARPRYPKEVLKHLKREIGFSSQWDIVDVGSGTGISCELFLQNGNAVTAVEPNAPMRLAAEKSLKQFEKFVSVDATAEETTLPDDVADLVVAAQAFHWFDRDAAKAEFRRILRPRGHVLLMWNARELGGTPFLDAYEKLLIDFGTDYLKVRHYNIADAELTAFFSPSRYRTGSFPNVQTLDFDGLKSRVLSSSYIPGPDDPRYEPMLKRLREAFDECNQGGKVELRYQTELFFGQLGA